MANARQFMAARTAAWAKNGAPLPYLRRVAYLQSHGTEYIDTGYEAAEKRRWYLDLIWLDVSNFYTGAALGTRTGTNLGIRTEGNGTYFIIDTYQMNRIGLTAVNGVRYKIDYRNYNGNSVSVKTDSGDYEFQLSEGQGGTSPFHLFGINRYDTPCGKVRVFECVLENNGMAVRHFTPVIDLSGRPAMYDEVSGQFFYNQGTGEFTWGELET